MAKDLLEACRIKVPETLRIPLDLREKVRSICEGHVPALDPVEVLRLALRLGVESKRLTG